MVQKLSNIEGRQAKGDANSLIAWTATNVQAVYQNSVIIVGDVHLLVSLCGLAENPSVYFFKSARGHGPGLLCIQSPNGKLCMLL